MQHVTTGPAPLPPTQAVPVSSEERGAPTGPAGPADPAVGPPGPAGGAAGPAARRRFTALWVQALRGVTLTPLGASEAERRLGEATDRLAQALLNDPHDPDPAASAGTILVDTGFSTPEALRQTIDLVGARLAATLGCPPTDEVRRRVTGVQAALSAGFLAAERARLIAQQETIRAAVLVAQAQTQRMMRASEARFRAVFGGTALGIGIGGTDGRLLDVNPALAGLLGLPAEAFTGRTLTEFFPTEQRPELAEAYARLLRGEVTHLRLERRLARPSGDDIWVDLSFSLIQDEDGEPRWHVVMVEDVTERHDLRVRLEHEALHDPLTGLPNRTLFVQRLEALLRRRASNGRVGLCFLDLDGFKMVNDSLGHHVGDELLVAVAQRLEAHISRAGHLIARLGGDEFVVLLGDTTGVEQVEAIAAEVLDVLADPFLVADNQLAVTASVGVVERPVAGTDTADLMRAADITLYRAKADGRGRWATFDPHRNSQQVARYTLSTAMPAALDRDEFLVEFQPVVRLADGRTRGAEALVRWRHRELGLLSPKRFVGLAEETGAIVPIGRRVLELACAEASRWPAGLDGVAPYVSVNVATRQFRDPRLVGDIARVLDQSGLDPHRLQLELAESVVMTPGGRGAEVLEQLAELGVRLALDDFGTGFCNLTYLRDMPIDALKLGGVFVQRLGAADFTGDVDARIVETLISLAHALGLTVVAEGIETEQQRDRLHALGCDTGQGWHFAPALSPEDLLRHLVTAGVAGPRPAPRVPTVSPRREPTAPGGGSR